MSTLTTEGIIPYLRLQLGEHVINAPVCVQVLTREISGQECVQAPMRTRSGELIYALPGGGRYAEKSGILMEMIG